MLLEGKIIRNMLVFMLFSKKIYSILFGRIKFIDVLRNKDLAFSKQKIGRF